MQMIPLEYNIIHLRNIEEYINSASKILYSLESLQWLRASKSEVDSETCSGSGVYVIQETVWEAGRDHLSRGSGLLLVLNNKLVGNNKRVATLKEPAGRISPEPGEGVKRSCGMLLFSRDRLPNLAWKLPYCVYSAHSLPPSYFIPRLHNRLFVLRFYPPGPDSVWRWRSLERRWRRLERRRVSFDLLDLSLFTLEIWTTPLAVQRSYLLHFLKLPILSLGMLQLPWWRPTSLYWILIQNYFSLLNYYKWSSYLCPFVPFIVTLCIVDSFFTNQWYYEKKRNE